MALIEAAARLAFLLWAALTSAFCLLLDIPVARKMILSWKVYPPWVDAFLNFHVAAYWAALGLSALVLARGNRTARGPRAYLTSGAALGFFLLSIPALDRLEPGFFCRLLGISVWLLPAWWEFLMAPAQPARTLEEGNLLEASVAAGLVNFTAWSLLSPSWMHEHPGMILLGLEWSLMLHVLLFLFPFALFSAVPAPLRFLLSFLALTLAMDRLVLGSFDLDPALAWSYSAAAALSLSLPLRRIKGPRGKIPAYSLAAVIAVLGAAAASRAAPLDWNHVLATVIVLTTWILSLLVLLGPSASSPASRGRLSPAAAAWAILSAIWLAAGSALAFDGALRGTGLSLRKALVSWEEREPSFRAARRLMGMAKTPDSFYIYLRRHANLPAEVLPKAADLRPAPRWSQEIKNKPDIFIIMIDSLRPDYLGAYNPKARFTPHIDAFAAESMVVEKAFTPYGGTGLSVPAFWAGSLLPHRALAPLPKGANSLETLLRHEKYRLILTMDLSHRVDLLPLAPGGTFEESPQGYPKLCHSLNQLWAKIKADKSSAPLFAFAFPQDVHVSVVETEVKKPPQKPQYLGFRTAHAHQIAQLDSCFGTFISRLKAAGRYENSLILLTSDHGDLLGEGGEFGHAGSLRPEVIRVPLILHLPRSLSAWRRADPEAAVLLTDVVPTLYALFGHQHKPRASFQGRPFLSPHPQDGPQERAPRLLASSYTPIFGILSGNGRTLYFANANEGASYYYDLNSDPAAEKNLSGPSLDAAQNALIRERLEEINAAFGLKR